MTLIAADNSTASDASSNAHETARGQGVLSHERKRSENAAQVIGSKADDLISAAGRYHQLGFFSGG